MTIHWKAAEQYFTVVSFFNFTQFAILETSSILHLALSGVKKGTFEDRRLGQTIDDIYIHCSAIFMLSSYVSSFAGNFLFRIFLTNS